MIRDSLANFKDFVSGVDSSVERNCVVEWDKDNVVATQLEGTWSVNTELSLELWREEPKFSKIKWVSFLLPHLRRFF